MPNDLDVRTVRTALYFIPVHTRVPLRFGAETTSDVLCARAWVEVETAGGQRSEGWGEVPLSVAWLWPAPALEWKVRVEALRDFCLAVAAEWCRFGFRGHPMEIGYEFQIQVLPGLLGRTNAERRAAGRPELPHLAAIACCAPLDIALHDAYGRIHATSTWNLFSRDCLNADLSWFFDREGAGAGAGENYGAGDPGFGGLYPSDFLADKPAPRIMAWHTVGGYDPLGRDELRGDEPQDGHPLTLADWIDRDGLTSLKIKLSGADTGRDARRILDVGRIALPRGARRFCVDFNCTAPDAAYVGEVLDRVERENPALYDRILYLEQPFAPDAGDAAPAAHASHAAPAAPASPAAHASPAAPATPSGGDLRALSARKPLFLDESAHDWRGVRRGRRDGWTGVALKTCKTLTGSILSLAWARKAGMRIMVQDLTNPMLAQIAHIAFASRAGSEWGVETNSMQFYPDASGPEARVHPCLFRRSGGTVSTATIGGPGIGYRIERIARELPEPAGEW